MGEVVALIGFDQVRRRVLLRRGRAKEQALEDTARQRARVCFVFSLYRCGPLIRRMRLPIPAGSCCFRRNGIASRNRSDDP